MRTISCPSCDAVFPESTIHSPATTRCPRCEELFIGPRRQRFSFVATKLTTVDFIHPAYCSACGCFLSFIERAGVTGAICRYPLCHHKRVAASAMELQKKTIEDIARKQAEDFDRVEKKLQEMGHDPAEHDIAILPASTRSLEKMNDHRKSALASKLAEVAAEIRLLGPIEENSTSFDTAGRPTDTAFVAQACATCRGDCCQNGGEHAYLTRRTLSRLLHSFQEKVPGTSLEDILRAYIDRVPEESYQQSCIYHTDKGCNLPGDMRSDTCNDFFCTGTRSLSSIVRGEKSPSVLVAALKGERIVRLAVINGHEMRYLLDE